MNCVRSFVLRTCPLVTLALCSIMPAAFGQIYAATRLQIPQGYSFANLDGSMNNYGQVLGEVTGAARVPVLWTNGIPQILPIPADYVYIAALWSYKVNDSGTVIGTVQEANTQNRHVLIWKNGVPARLQESMSQICPGNNGLVDQPDTYSTGLNSAGHIVGTTIYPGGQGCIASWFWDGAKFTPLPVPPPPPCHVGQTATLLFPRLNDADVVEDTVRNYFCTNWTNDKGEVIYQDPVIMYPPSFQTYSFVPLGSFTAFAGDFMNNAGMMAGCISCGAHAQIAVYDTVKGLRIIGDPAGYESLNNAGQVAYVYDPGQPDGQIRLWFNETSTPVSLPPGITKKSVSVAINDSGAIALVDYGVNPVTAYVITPALRCPTCR